MAKDIEIYTGNLTYRDINFSFAFDKKELHLIIPSDKQDEVDHWFMEEIGNGIYSLGHPLRVQEPFLTGECNENWRKIVFILSQGSYVYKQNSVLLITVVAYAVHKYDRSTIDRMSFSSPEIDYIHPVNQALRNTTKWEEFKQGIIEMHTKDFDATTTAKQIFTVDGKEISVCFGISRTMSTTIGEPPVSLHSTLMFEFAPTDDYQFIFRVWGYAKKFIQYLCYRKDVCLPETTLSAPCDKGKHESFATLYVLGETNDADTDSLKKGRYIRQANIAGIEGKILTDIAQDMLYMRHFPESYKAGRRIDASRFVMITAAFEWEFRRAYPNGLPKSQRRMEAEDAVRNTILELIENNTGKEKELYKFLLKSIGFSSLKNEIEKIGADYSDVIQVLGSRLYELNGEHMSYSDMGQRLAKQRNDFAHGNLDEEFIGLSLLDLMFAEYVVYAMQLKYYGVESLNIQKAINDLFRCGLAL